MDILKMIDENIERLNKEYNEETDFEKRKDIYWEIDSWMEQRLSAVEQMSKMKDLEIKDKTKDEIEAKVENLKTQKEMMKFDILSKLNPMSMMGGLLSFRASKMHEEGIDRRFQQQLVYEDKGVIPSPNMRKYF